MKIPRLTKRQGKTALELFRAGKDFTWERGDHLLIYVNENLLKIEDNKPYAHVRGFWVEI